MAETVPCAHIADYYQHRWEHHKCIGFNLLRHGYRQWAEGRATDPANNLYSELPATEQTCRCGGTVYFEQGERHARCFNYECGAYLHR